jgi:hypothetical protein
MLVETACADKSSERQASQQAQIPGSTFYFHQFQCFILVFLVRLKGNLSRKRKLQAKLPVFGQLRRVWIQRRISRPVDNNADGRRKRDTEDIQNSIGTA